MVWRLSLLGRAVRARSAGGATKRRNSGRRSCGATSKPRRSFLASLFRAIELRPSGVSIRPQARARQATRHQEWAGAATIKNILGVVGWGSGLARRLPGMAGAATYQERPWGGWAGEWAGAATTKNGPESATTNELSASRRRRGGFPCLAMPSGVGTAGDGLAIGLDIEPLGGKTGADQERCNGLRARRADRP